MSETTAHIDSNDDKQLWQGGHSPFKASYGKVMMWYFLISDTFTFAAFLIAYGAQRVAQIEVWPNPSDVISSASNSGSPPKKPSSSVPPDRNERRARSIAFCPTLMGMER